ncbi:MAG TPA: competence/damage-inducible protein A [Alphaproteobacteria bacterium]
MNQAASSQPTACVLIIGNEILSGRTQDVNLNYIAKRLAECGVRLAEARVIPDQEAAIIDAVNACRAAYDWVFTTGGIGPTHDDITAECIAKAFGVGLEQNAEARALLERQYRERNVELNEARLRMANMPAGALLVDNPVSGAPGFQVGNVFVLAGVPSIMQAMFESAVEHIPGGVPLSSRTVVAYLPEGTLAGPLKELQGEYPDIDMGSYPFYRVGRFGSNLVLRAADEGRLEEAVNKLVACVDRLGGEPQLEG